MKILKTLFSAAILMLCFGGRAHADSLTVTVDTSGLSGNLTLDFYLTDGSGTGDGNTVVSIGDFLFGGGGVVPGTISTFGSATGDISSGISLTDANFFSEWQQQFTAGSQLAFSASLNPSSVDSPFPDGFGFLIDEVPTTDTLAGNILFVEFDSLHPAPQAFSLTDSAGNMLGNVTATPTESAPEPSTLSLMLVGIAFGLLFFKSRPFCPPQK
jgi:hypothetical protein